MTCFLFGHATAPAQILTRLEETVERYYLEFGIDDFYVGNRGQFDSLAVTAVKRVKKRYPAISLYLVLAYHPAERKVDVSAGFDGSFYPPLEGVPRRYAIVRANRYMVDTADGIICYSCHGGNSGTLLRRAQRRKTLENIPVTNVAERG